MKQKKDQNIKIPIIIFSLCVVAELVAYYGYSWYQSRHPNDWLILQALAVFIFKAVIGVILVLSLAATIKRLIPEGARKR